MTAKTHRLGLTTSEAARHLGVSLSTIRRWSDLGYLRVYRTPGGQRRFSVEQLDEFIESLESGATPRQAPRDDEHDEHDERVEDVQHVRHDEPRRFAPRRPDAA
jgi:excisionase family DNA binding protein